MPENQLTSFIFKNRFNDLDEFLATIRGWDLDWSQLKAGKFRGELFQLCFGEFLFTRGKFNLPFRQRDGAPEKLWTFAMMTNTSSPARWRNREIAGEAVMILPPGSEGDVVSRPGYDVYTLSFTEKVLADMAQIAGFLNPHSLTEGARTRIYDRRQMQRLQRKTFQIIGELENKPSLLADTRLGHYIEYEISQRLLSVLASSRKSASPMASRMRDRAVLKAVEYIENNAQEPINLPDLCLITEASERTLRYGFLERYGVSPKAYLQSFRLNGVRKELRQADPADTWVIEIANKWGFWHMGQFAADYRTLFGELPSKTLHRYKQPTVKSAALL
jgi:AraC family transcriptional regulator, ethanolamine operon transcriptional activator